MPSLQEVEESWKERDLEDWRPFSDFLSSIAESVPVRLNTIRLNAVWRWIPPHGIDMLASERQAQGRLNTIEIPEVHFRY